MIKFSLRMKSWKLRAITFHQRQQEGQAAGSKVNAATKKLPRGDIAGQL